MEEEKDELSNQRVFSLNHSDIPRGMTQCEKHNLVKLNDNEVRCTKCPTVLIVNSDYLEKICQKT